MIDSVNIFEILSGFLLIFSVCLLIYRKCIYSIFDPLFFFIISQAFTIELGFIEIKNSDYLINFLLCQILYTLGFLVFQYKIKPSEGINDTNFWASSLDLEILKYFVFISFVIIVAANLYFVQQKGLIILSNDPSVNKFADYEGGLGFVRRINWGLLHLFSIVCLYLFSIKKRKVYVYLLLVAVLINLSGGSKGSIIEYVLMLSLFGLLDSFKENNTFQKINKYKIPALVIGFFISIFILSVKNTDFENSFFALMSRLLYSGDVIVFYYNENVIAHFSNFNWIDFFSYEFNSITGFFRLAEYKNPIGYDLVLFSISRQESLDTVQGPNLPFYVKGFLFFGMYGALAFSLSVGFIVGYIRRNLFVKTFKSINIKWILVVIFLNLKLFSYPQDSGLFVNIIFDTFIFALLPYILSVVIVSIKFQNRSITVN